MKRFFLDTNVLIDFLSDQKPFSTAAAALFEFSLSKKIQLYISAVSYNNIYYIIRQSKSHVATIDLLNELTEMVEIADVTKTIIKKALISGFKDFEDSIQYHCALTISKIDLIVTRDTKGYKKSTLPVMNPQEAISFFKNDLI